MAEGTPQAFSMRFHFALVALSVLVMGAMVSAPQANAQTPEGTVKIIPPISSVAAERGPFTVFIVLEDLGHYGALLYDDNRDTVPDREVESIGLAAFEFTVAYDQAVLAVAGVERGPALERSGRSFQCLPPADEPGSFSFGCVSTGSEPPGLHGTLTLASLSFRPLGPGSGPLLLEAGLAGPLGDEVPVAVSGGVVRVTGSPVATATRALPSGNVATPSPQPDARPLDTPSSVFGATEAPTEPAAPEHGQTPEVPTAPAVVGDGQTPEALTTPAATDGGNPKELTVREGDLEAENSRSAAAGGRLLSGVALWSVTALGSVTAAGALGLAAVLWRRRRDRGGG